MWGLMLHELYGASESYGNCHIGPDEARHRPGSVGCALSGTIHITDPSGTSVLLRPVSHQKISGRVKDRG